MQGNLLVMMLAALADEIVQATDILLEAQRMTLDAHRSLSSTHRQMLQLMHTYSGTPDPVHSDAPRASDSAIAEIPEIAEISKPAADAPAAQDGGQDVTAAGRPNDPASEVGNGSDDRGAAERTSPKSEQAVSEAGPATNPGAEPASDPSAVEDEVLTLYARHGMLPSTLAARVGKPVSEVDQILTAARGRLDPHVIRGDQRRQNRDGFTPPQPDRAPEPSQARIDPVDLPRAAPVTRAPAPQAEARTVAPDESDIGNVIAHIDYSSGTVSHDLRDTKLAPTWLRVVDRLKDQRVYPGSKLAADGRFVSEVVFLKRLPEAQAVLAKVGLTIHHQLHVGFQLRRLAQ